MCVLPILVCGFDQMRGEKRRERKPLPTKIRHVCYALLKSLGPLCTKSNTVLTHSKKVISLLCDAAKQHCDFI